MQACDSFKSIKRRFLTMSTQAGMSLKEMNLKQKIYLGASKMLVPFGWAA